PVHPQLCRTCGVIISAPFCSLKRQDYAVFCANCDTFQELYATNQIRPSRSCDGRLDFIAFLGGYSTESVSLRGRSQCVRSETATSPAAGNTVATSRSAGQS